MKADILINKEHLLNDMYMPDDLFQMDANENNFHKFKDPSFRPSIRVGVLPYFMAMQSAALKEGYSIIVDSGYRPYYYQQKIWNKMVEENGLEKAKSAVAVPGASEHQSGLAIDIAFIRNGIYTDDVKENDEEFMWLQENAHLFGFILRYPKDKEKITGYKFEPWHFRFVGIRLAKLLKDNNITLEEYYLNKNKYDEALNKIRDNSFLADFQFTVAYYSVEKEVDYDDIRDIMSMFSEFYPNIKIIKTPDIFIKDYALGIEAFEDLNVLATSELIDFVYSYLGKSKKI